MRIALACLIVIGFIPLLVALRAHRGTSLFHALIWALVAWLAWGCAFLFDQSDSRGLDPFRYFALCLTGCAGIAVLGARRPIVGAWNFVALGLLAVMVLPLLETLFIGTPPVDTLRIVFMTATIAVGTLNYLQTSFGPAGFVLLLACAGEITHLFAPDRFAAVWIFDGLMTAVPWLGWLGLRARRRDSSAFDRLWLDFRDQWGLMWSQRVREQFNAAAQNAGWGVTLKWRGLKDEAPQDQEKHVEALRAILQRFLSKDQR